MRSCSLSRLWVWKIFIDGSFQVTWNYAKFLVLLVLMFVSTIIPTINRPTLSIAVQSVLDQNFDLDDFEVIVVNDSGKRLSDSTWMKSSKVRVIDTNRRERSVARNAGAAIALGKYLH